MGLSPAEIGRQGEAAAAQYLAQRGCTLLTTNWRCAGGEIDIIAERGGLLMFVEVRTRRAASVDVALESITPRKRQRMLTAAYAYLAQQGLEDADWRIDVIVIAIRRGSPPIVQHLENGLDW